MHIGSLPFVSGMSGKQDHPLLPGLSTVGWLFSSGGKSRIVAFAEMDIGPAVIAFAIFWAFVIVFAVFAGMWGDSDDRPSCNAPSATAPVSIADSNTNVRLAGIHECWDVRMTGLL